MNLSPLALVPFDDDDAFAEFVLAHGLAHNRIAATMYANSHFYNTYPLYDTPKEDRSWLLDHQAEHQSIFVLLNLTGLPDLSTVDLSKESEFIVWMLLHRDVHERINAQLNIV